MKCKSCNVEFTPHQYASRKTKCKDCIFSEYKKKLCEYQKKQNLRAKPKKPIKVKMDKEQQKMQDGFRKGLIARYGLEYVEWLENNK